MSARHFISRFTPSRSDPKDLEAILVQREGLLSDAVERVVESARSDNKHHLLFIGPRGSGKTHFVTLLFHRVDAIDNLQGTLRIAWLNEDETCARLLDLLMRIATALEKKYPAEFPADFYEDLASVSEAEATQRLSELLLARLGPHRLLVLVENLDALFEAIGENGQKALRALVQNHPVFCLVATAQALFEGVQKRDSPFFGSFQIEHFQPLTVAEAAELLAKIARLNGDDALAEFLATPSGCARVRALHHLSGGNHRIYIVLSELINRDSIDDLARPFEEMLDELTPYYEDRIRWLAPLQRRIVELLCRQQQPIAVKTIAKQLLASHQTVASQLKLLRELRYVESHPRGRESLYELSEPLMRLCVEIKDNQRKEPLRLLIDFLRVWYDEPELEHFLQSLPSAALERAYVEQALAISRNELLHVRLRLLLEDVARLDRASPDGQQVRKELDSELPSQVIAAIEADNPTKAKGILTHAIEVCGGDEAWLAWALLMRGLILQRVGQAEDAMKDFDALVALDEASVADKVSALLARSKLHRDAGHDEDAMRDLDTAIQTSDDDPDAKAEALLARGLEFMRRDRYEAGTDDLSKVAALEGVSSTLKLTARCARVVALSTHFRTDALQEASELLALETLSLAQRAQLLAERANIYMIMNEGMRALSDVATVLDMVDPPPAALILSLAIRFASRIVNEPEAALEDLSRMIPLLDARPAFGAAILFKRGQLHRRLGSDNAEIEDYSRAIDLAGATTNTLAAALFARAAAHFRLGRWDEGLADLQRALTTAIDHRLDDRGDTAALIKTILRSGLGESIWASRIKLVLTQYAQHDSLAALGSGLVRSLRALRDVGLDGSGLDAWRSAWLTSGQGAQGLTIPFRIFSTGIEYLKSKDKAVLFDLLKEERSVLEEALELDESTI